MKLDKYDIICYSAISILILMFILGIGCIIYYFVFYQVKILPTDKICIAKCSSCDNLIVSKSEENCTCKWSAPCERFKGFKYLAKVITPNDPNYSLYKLKYDFYQRHGKNFDKFYEWYKVNKDKKFYKYIKHYITIEDRPVYETRYRSVSRHIGLSYTIQRMPYSVIVGWKQVPIQNKSVKYKDPKDTNYKKVECDIFEYYTQIIENVGTWN